MTSPSPISGSIFSLLPIFCRILILSSMVTISTNAGPVQRIGVSLGIYTKNWESEGLVWRQAASPQFLGIAGLSLGGTVGRGLNWSLALPYAYSRSGGVYGNFREYLQTPQGDLGGDYYPHRSPTSYALGFGDAQFSLIPPAKRIYSIWSVWIPTDWNGPEPIYHRADNQAPPVTFKYAQPWLAFQLYRIGYFGAFRVARLSLSASAWLALHDPAGDDGGSIQPGDAAYSVGLGRDILAGPTQRTSLRVELGYSALRWQGRDGPIRRDVKVEPTLSHRWVAGPGAGLGIWANVTAWSFAHERVSKAAPRQLGAGMRYDFSLPSNRPSSGGR